MPLTAKDLELEEPKELIRTCDLIKLFTKEEIEKAEEEQSIEGFFDKNPFQEFALKKLKESLKEEKFMLSSTGVIQSLPAISEEIRKGYSTERKRQASSDMSENRQSSIESNGSLKSGSQTSSRREINEKWVTKDISINSITSNGLTSQKRNTTKISTIGEVNLTTARIKQLLQRSSSSITSHPETNKSPSSTTPIPQKRIEALLKTNSDSSPYSCLVSVETTPAPAPTKPQISPGKIESLVDKIFAELVYAMYPLFPERTKQRALINEDLRSDDGMGEGGCEVQVDDGILHVQQHQQQRQYQQQQPQRTITNSTSEVMQNFLVLKDHEMHRTRAQKTHEDNMFMNEFVEELFDKILSRADLFLVAFEQPIKRNPIDVLRSMQNGNRNRMNKTSEFAVLTDNLYKVV